MASGSAYHQIMRMGHIAWYPHEDWMDDAACATLPPDLFFPTTLAELAEPIKVCSSCPVRAQCLAYALHYRIAHGVWGGHSERSRRRILKRKHSIPTTPEVA